MKFRLLTFITSVVGLFTAPALADEIRLHGSSAITENLLVNHKTQIEEDSRHKLLITETTPDDGITDVAKEYAHIFMTTTPLADVLENADYVRPSDTLTASAFEAYEVGETRVAFAVNKENPVRELSAQQITNILNGTVTNWREVGGANLPIIVVIGKDGENLRTMTKDALLSEAAVKAKRREVSYAVQIPGFVEAVPNAFGVMSAGDMSTSIAEIQTDVSITQPIYFVTKGTPSADVMAVINATKRANGISD
jgi:phosphate transport system substrate-binding protein